MAGKNNNHGNGNEWLQRVLERMEDHILWVRQFMAESQKRWQQNEKRWEQNEKRLERNDKRWEHNDQRWKANHKLLVHMLEEIRNIKMKGSS